jgi:hypothetical protein
MLDFVNLTQDPRQKIRQQYQFPELDLSDRSGIEPFHSQQRSVRMVLHGVLGNAQNSTAREESSEGISPAR